MADSYAVYVITKVNKKTVKLHWVDYCDGWIDDRCGKFGSLEYKFAYDMVSSKDRLIDSISKKQVV